MSVLHSYIFIVFGVLHKYIFFVLGISAEKVIVEEDGYNKEEEEDGESSEEETTTANTQKIHSPGWSPSTEFCMFNLNSDKDWSKINLKYDFLSCLLTGTRVLLIDSNDWPTKKLIQ